MLINKVLQGFCDFSAAYLDELIIYSHLRNKYLQHIQWVLKTLKEAGKSPKCQFTMAHCEYLGHDMVSGEGYPILDILEAIILWSPNHEDSGKNEYYCKLIISFLTIPAPPPLRS